MYTNTRRYLDQLISYSAETGTRKFSTDIGNFSVDILKHWKQYLEENETIPADARIDGTYIRPIRPSFFLTINQGGRLWIPILNEIHKDGRKSKGKTHGGGLKLCKERFCSVKDGLRELKHELLYQMATDPKNITPRGVIVASNGMVLQFYHAELEHEPTHEDLTNHLTKWENFESRWYTYHTLSEEMYNRTLDVHTTTAEMILAEHFWDRTVHLRTFNLSEKVRENILEGAGIDYPVDVFEKADVYYQFTRKGFLPAIKILIKAGIFMCELQYDEAYFGKDLREKDNFRGFAAKFVENIVARQYETLLEDRLLYDYLL